jgi:hypothetical protein
MYRRRLLVLAGLVLAVTVAGWSVSRTGPEVERLVKGRLIDREAFDRIEVGMGQAEVEAILGGPPGDFRSGRAYNDGESAVDKKGETLEKDRLELWSGNQGRVAVFFTEQGAVRGVVWWKPLHEQPSLAEQIRDWLRRLWP